MTSREADLPLYFLAFKTRSSATLLASATAQAQTDSTSALLAPGISHALARHRAATIHDVRYDLALDVTPLDSAVGHVTVYFQRADTGDAILDFRGRRLGRALANGHPLQADAARNGHLLIPARLLRPGENTIALPFVTGASRPGQDHPAHQRRERPDRGSLHRRLHDHRAWRGEPDDER